MNPEALQLLDSDTISRAESLGLAARFIVEGYMAGDHKSPYRGFAIEFAQHREYSPGDDVRHLDWKVLGRTERYYIKQYEQETNYIAHILIDGSESMLYKGSSAEISKLEYAKSVAACLSYLVLHQRDSVSLTLFDEDIRQHLPRSDARNQLFRVLETLTGFEPEGETALPHVLHEMARRVQRKGIVIIISDFFDEESDVIEGIQHLRFAGHEVLGLQVLDNDEIEFPFTGLVEFEGLENLENFKTRPSEIKKTYLTEMEGFRERLRSGFERSECHFVTMDTSKPLDDALGGYLTFRKETG